jgi:hypothetical protein
MIFLCGQRKRYTPAASCHKKAKLGKVSTYFNEMLIFGDFLKPKKQNFSG